MTRPMSRFIRGENGSSSVEFALWFPIYIGLLISAVDLSMGIFQVNRSWDVARDLTRQVAVGALSYEDARQQAMNRLGGLDGASVTFTRIDERDVQVDMVVQPSLILLGGFDISPLNTVNLRYVMREEVPPANAATGSGGASGEAI